MIHLIEAGHSYKVYGIKGELVVDFKPQYRKHILNSKVVFIKLEGNAVPFFIESIRGTDELMVKFKQVDTPEVARDLSNQIIYIDDTGVSLEEEIEVQEELNEMNTFLHFEIQDLNSGFKGTIKDIEEFPGQLMALVEIDAKQVMIPIHEDWIVDIDEKKKQIKVNLPDGLLEL